MIKKFVGVLFTLAVLALIVFVLLGWGSYRSMLPEGLFATETAQPAVVENVVVSTPGKYTGKGDLQKAILFIQTIRSYE